MDFDPEFIVRMVRAGVPVINIPTPVDYPQAGVSHFRMRKDNILIARAYLRLAAEALKITPRTRAVGNVDHEAE